MGAVTEEAECVLPQMSVLPEMLRTAAIIKTLL